MNKKEFLKLKQLDRIEYILLKNRLEDNYNFDFIHAIYQYLYLLFPIITLGLLMYLVVKDLTLLFSLLKMWVLIFKPYFIILISLWIIFLILYIKKSKELDRRFLKNANK